MKITMKKIAAALMAILLMVQVVPALGVTYSSSIIVGSAEGFKEALDIVATKGTAVLMGQELELDVNEDYVVTWKSSDEKIATIDKDGILTAIAEGTVTITAESGRQKANKDITIIDPAPLMAQAEAQAQAEEEAKAKAEEEAKAKAEEEAKAKEAEGQPTEEQPTEEQPTEEQPTEEQPTEEQPTEEQPTEEQPTEELPTEEQPTEEQPTEEQPTEEQPTEEQPTEEQPTEEQPTEEQPTEEQPTEEQPTEEQPTEEQPTEEQPTEEQPTEEQPTEEQPTEEQNKPEKPEEKNPAEPEPKPIEKRIVVIMVNGENARESYNGEEQTLDRFVATSNDEDFDPDKVKASGEIGVSATDCGIYELKLEGIEFTYDDPAVIPHFVVNNSYLRITPAPVTVTANEIEKEEGSEDPELTATVSGLFGDDTIEYTLTREAGEFVGEYQIDVTGEEQQGNYRIKYVPGTFTITGEPTVEIETSVPEGQAVYLGTEITMKAITRGFGDVRLTYQWQWSTDNEHWTDIEGATAKTYKYELSMENAYYIYRVCVNPAD